MASLEKKDTDELVEAIIKTYKSKGAISHIEGKSLPNISVLREVLHDLSRIIFPGYDGDVLAKSSLSFFLGDLLNSVFAKLTKEVTKSLLYREKDEENMQDFEYRQKWAEKYVKEFLKKIPLIRDLLRTDIIAAEGGDPAAKNYDEIILSYPCIKAMFTYRLAHELYVAGIPLIPRMLSEEAHSATGIDIHPGAHIGESFFIDHGTGVVIGETCRIGKNVKIYQGVTLGALSFPKDEKGKIIKGKKRHPQLEDDVTIYAGATILGPVVIGASSVIGGNVWLMDSVPEQTIVTISKPELIFKNKKKKSAS